MFTILLILLVIDRYGVKAGGFVILGVLAVFILCVASAARDEAKAYHNCVQYWKNFGRRRRR